MKTLTDKLVEGETLWLAEWATLLYTLVEDEMLWLAE